MTCLSLEEMQLLLSKSQFLIFTESKLAKNIDIIASFFKDQKFSIIKTNNGSIYQSSEKQLLEQKQSYFDLRLYEKERCDKLWICESSSKSECVFLNAENESFLLNSPVTVFSSLSKYLRIPTKLNLEQNSEINQEFYDFLNTLYEQIKEEKAGAFGSKTTQEMMYFIFVYLNKNINEETAQAYIKQSDVFQTVKKWFFETFNKEILEKKKSDKIIILHRSSIMSLLKDEFCNFYQEKQFSKKLTSTNRVVFLDENQNKYIYEQKEKQKQIKKITICTNQEKKQDEYFGYELTKNIIKSADEFLIYGEDEYESEFLSNLLKREYKKIVLNNSESSNIAHFYQDFFNFKVKKYQNDISDHTFVYVDLDAVQHAVKYFEPKNVTKENPNYDSVEYFLSLEKILQNDKNRRKFLTYFNKEKQNNFYKRLDFFLHQSVSLNNLETFKTLSIVFLRTCSLFNGTISNFFYMYKYLEYLKIITEICDLNVRSTIEVYQKIIIKTFLIYQEMFEDNNTLDILKFFVVELESVNHGEFRQTELKQIGQFLNLKNSNFLSSAFSNPFEANSATVSHYHKSLNDMIYKKQFKQTLGKIENENFELLLLSKTIYTIVRALINRDKWYVNNNIIEFLIGKSEDIVNHFISNIDNYNPLIYHRVITLISAKNNLKIRYNIENKRWDTLSLINQYRDEVLFILKQNLHLVWMPTVSKGLDELTKVQNYYNYFNIPVVMRKEFFEEFRKLSLANICLHRQDRFATKDIDLAGSRILGTENIDEENIEYLRKYTAIMAPYYESARGFTSASLFSNINIVRPFSKKGMRELEFKKMTRSSWNIFNTRDKDNIYSEKFKLLIKPNTAGIDFVYEV
jgi:hypothetical protein